MSDVSRKLEIAPSHFPCNEELSEKWWRANGENHSTFNLGVRATITPLSSRDEESQRHNLQAADDGQSPRPLRSIIFARLLRHPVVQVRGRICR